MLDNREIATLILLGAAAAWGLLQQKLRSGLGSVFRTILGPLILIPLIGILAWIGLELWVGMRLGLWNTTLIKGTVLWVVGSAGVLFFNCTQAAAAPNFFKRTLRGMVGVAVFVEFFMNLYVLSLPAELVLQVMGTFLSLLAVFTASKPGYRPLRISCEALLTAIGFALFVYTLRQTYLGWHEIDVQSLVQKFALPLWLTVGLLPFLYVLSFYSAYDAAFRTINLVTSDRRSRWRSRFALLSTLHLNSPAVHKFNRNWVKRLSEAQTWHVAQDIVADFLKELRQKRQTQLDEQKRLRHFAGSQETDESGRRLDHREFAETVDALRLLETCQMVWYKNHGSYCPDLLEKIGHDFTHQGLPRKAGVTLRTSKDGQSWYAWRRTVTGWSFAIGAAGPPPNQWEYDGPDPPEDFPGQDPVWGSGPFSDRVKQNWR